MLKYVEHLPQPALREHVVCFWRMTSLQISQEKPKAHRVFPDCCADTIFDFTGARGRSLTYAIGTMTRPISFSTTGAVDMLGIRFKAGGARSFLQVPFEKCTDLAVDLEKFWVAVSQQSNLEVPFEWCQLKLTVYRRRLKRIAGLPGQEIGLIIDFFKHKPGSPEFFRQLSLEIDVTSPFRMAS